MEGTLKICLLGRFILSAQPSPPSGLDSPRLQALLAYLALHRDAPLNRSQIAFLLWPESTEAQAHTNLRSLLHRLRGAFPSVDQLLQIDRQTITWRPRVSWSLDVAAFQEALHAAHISEQEGETSAARAHLLEALRLYQGDLLPGLYDEWVLAEREQLREACLSAIICLATLAEHAGDYPTAITALQQLLRMDPLREPGHRALIRLYALSGDRAGALRAYHTCVTTLERELGVPPSPATHQEYERVRYAAHHDPAPALHTSLMFSAPLVGRQAESAALQAAWRHVSAGAPGLVLLSGEAGLGKTRLAEEVLAWVGRQGVATATAHCYAAGGALAYGPVTTWLRSDSLREHLLQLDLVWLQELARLVPELLVARPGLAPPGPLTEGWQRQRLFEALTRAFATCRPLLLLLDDLQWCDHETLAWLRYVLHPEGGSQLLVLATMRGEAVSVQDPAQLLLADLDREGWLTRLALAPLSADETGTLAAQLAGNHLDDTLRSHIYAETEGNPLFIVELMRTGLPEHRHAADVGPATIVARPLPPRMQGVLTARLNQLSAGAQELAALAATIGRSFTIPVLHHAAGIPEDRLVALLDELWLRRIVREQGRDAYDFSHDKLREVAYGRLSLARRHLLHRRVAEALEEVERLSGSQASAEVALHYGQAGLVERAAPRYRQAAQAAAAIFANQEAIAYLQQGLQLLDGQQDALTVALQEDLGDVLLRPGRVYEAVEAYVAAAQRIPAYDRLARARLQRKHGLCAAARHVFAEALTMTHGAAALLGEEPQDGVDTVAWWHEWLENRIAQLWSYYHLALAPEHQALSALVVPVLERHGTPLQLYQFLHTHKALRQRQERYQLSSATLALAEEMLTVARRLDDQEALARSTFSLGFTLLWHGSPQHALASLQEALTRNQQIGDLQLEVQILTYQTIVYRQHGALPETERCAAAALAAATAAKLAIYIGAAQANLAWAAWSRGEHQRAGELAGTGLALMGHDLMRYPFLWLAIFPQLAIHTTANRLEAAVALIPLLFHPIQQPLPEDLAALLHAVTQAWETGDHDATTERLRQALILAGSLRYL